MYAEEARKKFWNTLRETLKEMDVENKKRARYYEYYTDRTWGAMSSYDLCINTGLLGTDAAAQIIKECVMKKENSNG